MAINERSNALARIRTANAVKGRAVSRRWREAIEVRRVLSGLAAGVVLLAAVTGAIELLKCHVPVLSLGVLYLFAVLPVAVLWGLAYAIAVSIASMAAFNFLFLPPLYTFTLADSRNWFALAAFVVTAVVVSELAARSRRQARESALLAEIATSLLRRGEVSTELDRIAAEAARARCRSSARRSTSTIAAHASTALASASRSRSRDAASARSTSSVLDSAAPTAVCSAPRSASREPKRRPRFPLT
jgi:K+-sensing histidine kinase KdpD